MIDSPTYELMHVLGFGLLYGIGFLTVRSWLGAGLSAIAATALLWAGAELAFDARVAALGNTGFDRLGDVILMTILCLTVAAGWVFHAVRLSLTPDHPRRALWVGRVGWIGAPLIGVGLLMGVIALSG